MFLFLFACLVPFTVTAGPTDQHMDQRLLQRHLIKVAPGRRLNINCVGRGAPTVVFEQGGDGMVFNWARVQPTISRLTRTCFYDRGGFGWSDPAAYPVTAISVTDDLRALLRAAKVKGKVVLVGHSIGGFYATMYADRFPERVAGLVLVDPGFSSQQSGLKGDRWDHDQASTRRGEGQLLRCADLARSGNLTLGNLAEQGCFALPDNAKTKAERTYALHAITRPFWYEAEHNQSVNYFDFDEGPSVSHRQEQAAARSFRDMPMTVLSSGHMDGDPWRTQAENALFARLWREGHAALARRSSRGRLTIVADAGHFIQNDQPNAVIAAIESVVAEARDRPR